MEAFRAFYHPDPNPFDPDAEDESKQVGAVLRAVEFEYARESLKSLKTIETMLKVVHKFK